MVLFEIVSTGLPEAALDTRYISSCSGACIRGSDIGYNVIDMKKLPVMVPLA